MLKIKEKKYNITAQYGDSGNSSPARGSPQRGPKPSLDDSTAENNNYNGSPVTMRNGSTSSQDAPHKSSPSHGMYGIFFINRTENDWVDMVKDIHKRIVVTT